MTIAARRTTPGPRYGSPSELARYLGVSTKTVRRRLDSGALPSYRVGRRVLVAFRDADQLVRRSPIMAIAHPTDTPLIDPITGRLRPLSEEERRARSAELRRALDDIADITDETDTDEIWADVFRGLDAARTGCPPSGPGS